MSLLKRIAAAPKPEAVAPARIDSFSGAYRFLSNFYPAKVTYGDMEYNTVEHGFVAAKSLDVEIRKQVRGFTHPGDAKHYGRRIALRADWEEVKVDVMFSLLREKFATEPRRQQLLDTGEAELIEGNTWGDRFWGVYNGEGKNMLGKLLMQVRAELRSK